jgi:hypothetical protein
MKNLHLIPTDKPSRLYEGNLGELVIIQYNSPLKSLHIYITSDEEIKDGDWYCSPNGIVSKYNGTEKLPDNWNKIILTTDQDLIKDGVQAIDDEFLEWFVENPNCEEVMVYKDERLEPEQDFHFYKITFALSEPLQETLENLYCKDCNKNLEICTCMDDTIDMKHETLEEPKQETAVEFLKKEYIKRGDCLPSGVFKDALEMEAKQDQNKYSEEDMREAIKFGLNGMYGYQFNEEGETENQISKYLQQFKNK